MHLLTMQQHNLDQLIIHSIRYIIDYIDTETLIN